MGYQGDGFNRVGGNGYGQNGWDSDDEYGNRRPPPGSRYVVVQRPGGAGGFGAGVPIGGAGGGNFGNWGNNQGEGGQ